MVNTNLLKIEYLMSIPHEVIEEKDLGKHDHLYNFFVIGDSGVGKLCLMNRFMGKEFVIEHQPTNGTEFRTIGLKINDKIIKLQ